MTEGLGSGNRRRRHRASRSFPVGPILPTWGGGGVTKAPGMALSLTVVTWRVPPEHLQEFILYCRAV